MHTQLTGPIATLDLVGRLTHEQHPALRAQVFPILATPDLETLRIDLSAVEYIDSSTLGLFLLIQERADAAGVEVVFVHPSPALMGEFRALHFNRLLTIEA